MVNLLLNVCQVYFSIVRNIGIVLYEAAHRLHTNPVRSSPTNSVYERRARSA